MTARCTCLNLNDVEPGESSVDPLCPLHGEPVEYEVTWGINLTAGSPREAAERALEILRDTDPANLGLVFEVATDDAGTGPQVVTIDLSPGAAAEVTLPLSLAPSLWSMLQEAAGLLDPRDPNPGDGEYRRGMVELICRSLGLTTDDYRAAVEAAITQRVEASAPMTCTTSETCPVPLEGMHTLDCPRGKPSGPRTYTATVTPEAAAALATSVHPDTVALDRIDAARPALDMDGNASDADLLAWVRETIVPIMSETGRL
jgi:hypothetical protein